MPDRSPEHADLVAAIAEKKAAVLAVLQALKVPSVSVGYFGQDGWDAYNAPETNPPSLSLMMEKAVEVAGIPFISLPSLMESLLEDVLTLHHEGWNNGAGGKGVLMIHVDRRQFTLFHKENVIDVVKTTTEV